jgi:hypothetical protein
VVVLEQRVRVTGKGIVPAARVLVVSPIN